MKTVLLILIIFTTINCQDNNTNKKLLFAETYIEENPDTTLIILRNIDTNKLSKNDDARYRVLLSQAYEKISIKITNDSIIAPAVDYYNKYGGNTDKIEALYYLAGVQKNGMQIKNATENYLKILSMFDKEIKDSTQLKLHASTYHNLASLYFEQDYHKEAKEYFFRSAEIFESLDKKSAFKNRFMLAQVTISEGKEAEGVKMLEQLRLSTVDKELQMWLDLVIISFSITADKDIFTPKRLLAMRNSIDYNSILKLNYVSTNERWSESPIFMYNTISAFVFYRNEMPQKAYEYIKKGMKQISSTTSHNIGYYKSASQIARVAGQMDAALDYQQLYNSKSDSIHTAVREQQVRQVEAEYRRKNADNLHVTQLHYRLYLLGLLLLLLIGAIVWSIKAYRQRLQKRDDLIANYLILIENYKQSTNSFTEQLSERDERESIVKNYLSSQRDMIQQIAEIYYIHGDSERFAEKIRELVLSDVMLSDIMSMTDLYTNGAVSRLKSKFPTWTQKNYNFAVLVIAGFSSQEISVMLGMSLGSIYTLKSKLKRKILEVSQDTTSEFIAYFS